MKKIRAVCFDLFHTLIDVGSVPDEVGEYTADLLGIERPVWNAACFSAAHEITRPTQHLDVIRTLAHSIDPSIPEEKIREAVDHRQRRFDHALKYVPETILDGLRRIRAKGYPLCLVSNASTAEVSEWPGSPLVQIFDAAIFSCHSGLAKPQVEIYQQAADRLGVLPGECLFIGDGGSNEHEGARRAGMTPVLMTYFIADSLSQQQLDQRRCMVEFEVSSVVDVLEIVA